MARTPDELIRINVRVLKDINLKPYQIKKLNGVDWSKNYEPPSFPAWEGEVEDGFQIYNENCHYGAIIYAVKSKPLHELEVISCNCSVCLRNGDLWIYSPENAVVLYRGEKLTDYAFLQKNCLYSFCSICSVSMVVRNTDSKDDDMPLNVRTINGIDLEKRRLQDYDGESKDSQ